MYFEDEDWGFGAQVPSWLDFLFQSLHAKKEQRWAVTLSGWPLWQRRALLWKLCQLEHGDAPCNRWVRVVAETASCCSTEFWANTPLKIQALWWFPLLLRAGCWLPTEMRKGRSVHRMLNRGQGTIQPSPQSCSKLLWLLQLPLRGPASP